MKVSALIRCLQEMPQDAWVDYTWDGCARGRARFVWVSKDGRVILSDTAPCDLHHLPTEDMPKDTSVPMTPNEEFFASLPTDPVLVIGKRPDAITYDDLRGKPLKEQIDGVKKFLRSLPCCLTCHSILEYLPNGIAYRIGDGENYLCPTCFEILKQKGVFA